jgi:hypothetical protein
MVKRAGPYFLAFVSSSFLFPTIGYTATTPEWHHTRNQLLAVFAGFVIGVFLYGYFKAHRARTGQERGDYRRFLLKGVIFALALVSLTNCATVGQSMLLGAAVGGGAGSGVGLAASHGPKGTLLGAGIGTAVGAGIGLLIHTIQERKNASSKNTDLDKDKGPFIPSLSDPEVQRIEVPAKIEGNKYIEKHFEWIIEKNSIWTK